MEKFDEVICGVLDDDTCTKEQNALKTGIFRNRQGEDEHDDDIWYDEP